MKIQTLLYLLKISWLRNDQDTETNSTISMIRGTYEANNVKESLEHSEVVERVKPHFKTFIAKQTSSFSNLRGESSEHSVNLSEDLNIIPNYAKSQVEDVHKKADSSNEESIRLRRKADKVEWKIAHESFFRDDEKKNVSVLHNKNLPKPSHNYVEENNYEGIVQPHKNEDNDRVNLIPAIENTKYQNFKRTIPKEMEFDTFNQSTTEDTDTILDQIYTLNSNKKYLNRLYFLTTTAEPNDKDSTTKILNGTEDESLTATPNDFDKDSKLNIEDVNENKASTTEENVGETRFGGEKPLGKNIKALDTMNHLVMELLQLIRLQNKTEEDKPFQTNKNKKKTQKREVEIFRKPRNPTQEYWSRTKADGVLDNKNNHRDNRQYIPPYVKKQFSLLTKEEAVETSTENFNGYVLHSNIEKRSANNVSSDNAYRIQKMMADLHAIIRFKRRSGKRPRPTMKPKPTRQQLITWLIAVLNNRTSVSSEAVDFSPDDYANPPTRPPITIPPVKWEKVTYNGDPCRDRHMTTTRRKNYRVATDPYKKRDTRYGSLKTPTQIFVGDSTFTRRKHKKAKGKHKNGAFKYLTSGVQRYRARTTELDDVKSKTAGRETDDTVSSEENGEAYYAVKGGRLRNSRSLRKNTKKSSLITPSANMNWLKEYNRKLRKAKYEDAKIKRRTKRSSGEKSNSLKGYHPPDYIWAEELERYRNFEKTDTDNNHWYNHEFADIHEITRFKRSPKKPKPKPTRDQLIQLLIGVLRDRPISEVIGSDSGEYVKNVSGMADPTIKTSTTSSSTIRPSTTRPSTIRPSTTKSNPNWIKITYSGEPCKDRYMWTSTTTRRKIYRVATDSYEETDTRYGSLKTPAQIFFGESTFTRIEQKKARDEHKNGDLKYLINGIHRHGVRKIKLDDVKRKTVGDDLDTKINSREDGATYDVNEGRVRNSRSLRKNTKKTGLITPTANMNWLKEYNRKLRKAKYEDAKIKRRTKRSKGENPNPLKGYNPPEFFRPEMLKRYRKFEKTGTNTSYWYNHEFADIKNPKKTKPRDVTRDLDYEYYM